MICFFCAISAVGNLDAPSKVQSDNRSIYSQIFLNPTGKNAYEDYAQAADIVAGPDIGVYFNWQTDKYQSYKDSYDQAPDSEKPLWLSRLQTAESLKGDTYLQVQNAMVERYGQALSIVRLALMKPVWQPRKGIDPLTTFPEYIYFKYIERLFAADAYLNFASGRSDLGTQDLVDGLRFAEHMPSGPLIGSLVSSAMETLDFAAIQRNLDRITPEGWGQIADLCHAHLSNNAPLVDALAVEAKSIDSTLSAQIGTVDSLKEILGTDSEVASKVPPQDVGSLVQDARPYAEAYYNDAISRFRGPEEEWHGPNPPWLGAAEHVPAAPTYSDLLLALMDAVTVNVDALATTFSRTRSQWRILRVYALVEIYRWEQGELPKSILEAATTEDLLDPFSGKKLIYEVLGKDRYRIFSGGTSDSGAVELVYHPPAKA